ncbi:MAG: hypothetical protein DME97_01990 [Verrucomicrobia bacterium]|nr:MAG: hypothetical protein DME97_01990 [Verrucomicrobiota bacterium]
MVEAAKRHPRRAILAAAILSVLISCYPIVFFGRSFVSANNVPMLYPGIPSLPGHDETETENFKGSDAGAIMWHDVPNSFIQSRALFRDGELPLWNRYNSCGLTLLGQGQSMFGDPLHTLVVLAAGEAWAWDLKFLLAKVLFCFGLGLAVYASCRHLPTALLLAFSSGFIGFFAYRFNHPAFFSVCYAPWLLACWLEITRAATVRSAVGWTAGLLLASWAELNSGTAKEAYMLLVSLHGCGFLVFLLTTTAFRIRKLVHLGFGGVALLLIAAPIWLTFFEALPKAYVPYKEAVHAYQIQPGLLIGLFDDIFYRAFNPNWLITNPSTNFLVLLGCLLALVYLRRLIRDRVFVAIAVSALCSASLVFGVVPSGVIEKIPIVKNIWHIDNTFSCVLLIELFVLAGFGLSYFVRRCARRNWKLDYAFLVLALLILFGAWLGFIHATQRIPNDFALPEQASGNKFFYAYAIALFFALLALPWLVRAIVCQSLFRRAAIPLAVLCLLCLHWRHGFQLHTGVRQIDDFVVNPPPRIDFGEPSAAIDFIQKQPGVFRTVGFGSVLFPGVNGIFGLESIYGPDPLANPYYHELLTAAGVRQEWSWRWIVERANPRPRPLYNLLNVRYFLDMPPRQRPDMNAVERPRFDLDVLQNEGEWPRAFFVGALQSYDRVEQFLDLLRQADSHPFAAAQAGDATVPDVERTAVAPAAAIPAHDYRLTNNTTTFTVDAPAPGVAVLTEAYVPGDFRVTLNGAPVDYFRVNHAFRGVKIPAAGKHVISYSYWPRHFTLSLVMAAIGSLLLLLWLIVSFRRARPMTNLTGNELHA